MKIVALVFIWAFAVIGQQIEDTPGWARLKISQDVFTVVQYGNVEIKVYEELRKPNGTKLETEPWYFFTPINLLLHHRAKCIFNRATNRNEIDVVIQFWNDDLRKNIIHHLKHNEHIENPKVAVIPFEQVMLTIAKHFNSYRPDTTWVPFNGKKLHNFCLIVDSEAECAALADYMLVEPNRFSFFRLEFNVNAVRSTSRRAVISIDSIRKGSLFSKLDQKFPHLDSVLLTAEDTEKLLSETVSTIIVSTFDDSEILNPNAEQRIYSMLQRLLKDAEEKITDEFSLLWSSVFYEKDNYRPDKLTKTINNIHQQSDDESQRMLRSVFSNTTNNNIDTALELIKHRLFHTSDSDSSSNSDSEQNSNSSSNSISKSSARSSDTDYKKKDEQRNDVESSRGVKIGAEGWGLTAKAEVKASDKNTAQSINERSGRNATSVNKYGSRSVSENQGRAREELRALSRQKDRSAVSNDQLAEKLAHASANSQEKNNEMREIFKMILEAKESVEWNGEKFQPKPMLLSRINLAKVRSSHTFGSHDVKVTYSKATLITGVNVASESSLETSYFLGEIQDALKKIDLKFKALEKRRLEEIERKTEAVEQKLDEQMNSLERSKLKEVDRYIVYVDQRTKELTEEQLKQSDALQNKTRKMVDLQVKLDEVIDTIAKLFCPKSIGIKSICKYLESHGCYCYVKLKTNWFKANRHCRSHGMQLVSIESEAEQLKVLSFLRENFLREHPRKEMDVWTSALYSIERNKWEWTSTRQELDFENIDVSLIEGWDLPKRNSEIPGSYFNFLASDDELPNGYAVVLVKDVENNMFRYGSIRPTKNKEYFMCEKTNPFFNNESKTQSCEITTLSSNDTIDLEWNCFKEVSGCYCYPTTPEAMDWIDAYILCKSIDMNLVSLETETEVHAVAIGLPDTYAEIEPKPNNKTDYFWWTSGIADNFDGGSVTWYWAKGTEFNIEEFYLDQGDSKLALAISFKKKRPDGIFTWSKLHYPLCEK